MGCINPHNNIEVTSIASPPNDHNRLEVVFSFGYVMFGLTGGWSHHNFSSVALVISDKNCAAMTAPAAPRTT